MVCPESTHLHLYAFDMMVVTKSSRFDLFEVSNHYVMSKFTAPTSL
jgi:hypothetical protein